jgi:hypothetical protein
LVQKSEEKGLTFQVMGLGVYVQYVQSTGVSGLGFRGVSSEREGFILGCGQQLHNVV